MEDKPMTFTLNIKITEEYNYKSQGKTWEDRIRKFMFLRRRSK